MANMWVRKSISALKAEAAASDEHGFKRSLSALNLTMLGIGAVIGAGFFVLTGHAAAENAGPAIALSRQSSMTANTVLPSWEDGS